MNKNLYQSCTIAGRSVSEFAYGADEVHPDCIALKLCLTNKIAELNAIGFMEFYANAEYGVSFFGAEAVIALRDSLSIKLNIICPHEEMANRYSREVRDRFFRLHELADSVQFVSRRFHDNCFRGADMYMIDNSDVLMTDCADSFIARYAEKQGIQVELLDKLPLKL